MKPGRLAPLIAPGVALGLWSLGGAVVFLSVLGPRGAALRQAVFEALEATWMVMFLWWLGAAVLLGWLAQRARHRLIVAPQRLLGAMRIAAADETMDSVPDIAHTPETQALAQEIDRLLGQRRALASYMARLVADASRSVAEQRDQLAALMTELDHAVVVCNREGRILLYNGRMRALARRISGRGGGDSAGAELIGLGRSIHALIDKAALDHALDRVEARIARGADGSAAAAQFVTASDAGHLLRASVAPVRRTDFAEMGGEADDSDGSDPEALTGFLLMLDDITEDHERQTRRDRALQDMYERSRAAVANMQAALDMLEYPDLSAADHDRFLSVIRDEVAAMHRRLLADEEAAAQDIGSRWPLHDMLGTDLLAAAVRRLAATAGAPITTQPMAQDLWLRIDSFGLIGALDHLARRILALHPDPVLWLRLTPAGPRAHLDLGWVADGPALDPRDYSALPDEPMAQPVAGALSVREVVDRHGGEIWLERERDGFGGSGGGRFFRLLLPRATADTAPPESAIGSRPEFYDFGLFAAGHASADDNRKLSELAFTVFDCEMTGLDPAGGDEIIQIGALRIVNTRILRGETIDQLVDPQRSIPEAGIAIHHITPQMVRGQPAIAEVLPVFHRFAADSVLVGHNIAFDMRFLKLKEAATGLRFDHPLLDTLLLSSVLHPAEDSHSLEAVAARLGVEIGARHTALGDAIATAEVFVRMIPLLARQGIETLGQARAASDRSQFARLRY